MFQCLIILFKGMVIQRVSYLLLGVIFLTSSGRSDTHSLSLNTLICVCSGLCFVLVCSLNTLYLQVKLAVFCMKLQHTSLHFNEV